jgi:hypothetical protein
MLLDFERCGDGRRVLGAFTPRSCAAQGFSELLAPRTMTPARRA